MSSQRFMDIYIFNTLSVPFQNLNTLWTYSDSILLLLPKSADSSLLLCHVFCTYCRLTWKFKSSSVREFCEVIDSCDSSEGATISINATPNTNTAGPSFDVTLKDSVHSQLLIRGKVCENGLWYIGESLGNEVVVPRFDDELHRRLWFHRFPLPLGRAHILLEITLPTYPKVGGRYLGR